MNGARWLLVLCLAAGAARAKKPEDLVVTAARAHFELGRALFKQQRYAQALREFELGYQMVPKPQFLLNMGQAHRHLGQFDQAARMYVRFLTEAAADDPDRDVVKELLAEVRVEIGKRMPPPPPENPPPPAVSAPAVVVTAPPPPPPKKKSRAGLIAGVVVGVVAVTALAVGLGVGLSQPAPCSGSSVPCLDLAAH